MGIESMAVLVTGGAGYIGSHMAWALLDAGHDVVVLDRLSTGFRWAVPERARFYLGDVADKTLLRQIFDENKIDAIIHFAGSIVVPDSVLNPLDYYDNNTVKSRELIAAAIEAGISNFIFSSTAAVYGSVASNALVRETAPLNPENPYGQSKMMTEIMLRDAARVHDFRYVALRYFNVAGADPQGRTGQSSRNASHLLKIACEAALGLRERVNVYGTDYPTPDGTGVRDYIHVSDLVAAHLRALDYLRSGGAALTANCGYGRGYSVLDVLNAVRVVSGRDFPIALGPRRSGDAASVVADPTVARQVLNWVPRHDRLQGIVRSALEWEQHLRRGDHDDIGKLRQRLVSGWS